MPKLEEFQKWVQENNLDVAYVSDFKNIEYFTGFSSDPIERILGLFVFPDHEPFIFAPALEVEVIREIGWPYPVYGYLDHEKPYDKIAKLIKEINPNPTKWGIEKENLTIERFDEIKSHFENVTVKSNLTNEINRLRLIKTPKEIEALKAAGKEADFALETAYNAVKVDKTEAEVAAELEYKLKKNGVMDMSFDTLIQAGAHAANPHGATDMNKIENNELVLFDLGTVHDGYISDVSRTIAVGELNEKQQDIFDTCLKAQLKAQAAVKPGVKASEIDKIARDVIEAAGYGEYFIHRAGHGMGLGEHEFPSIMEGNDLLLEEGMCFSIEPGIYIPDVAGVRIEDCVHVTADGCEPFTNTTKELRYAKE